MLTVIREMADAVAERRAQWLRERLDPEATAERAGRAARRDAGDRAAPARRRVAPHARAARRARRGRGRRRRRPRPRGDPARHRRRARGARQVELPEIPHQAPARLDRRPPRRLALSATAPTSSSPARASTAARSRPRSRSSATRCSSSATRRRSRSTSTPTTPTRREALFAEAGDGQQRRRRRHARADRRAQRRLAGGAVAPGVVAVACGEGMRALFEDLGAARGRRRARR